MAPPNEQMLARLKEGIALYGDLQAVLETERSALVNYEMADIQAAIDRRKTLVGEMAEWEETVRELVGDSVDHPITACIETLSGLQRQTGLELVETLKASINKVQHTASVNHILAERNLSTVERTLDFYTGGSSRTTYGSNGDMAESTRRGVFATKG